jgi:hypothetical protein
MLKRAGFTVPQHDGGDEPLRCDMRGLRVSGQRDDSLSWVVSEKRGGRNTYGGGPRKQGGAFCLGDVEQ